jgi:hypothetical protein
MAEALDDLLHLRGGGCVLSCPLQSLVAALAG